MQEETAKPRRRATINVPGIVLMLVLMPVLVRYKNDNGDCPHSRFPGFAPTPCMGSWWTWTPPPLQDGGRCRIRHDPTMTEHGICPGPSIYYTVSYIFYDTRVQSPTATCLGVGCEGGPRSRTPTPRSKLAKLELRPPIFAGFFFLYPATVAGCGDMFIPGNEECSRVLDKN
jgi:hypothetical protein